ncbi:MAG: type III-A CRISPR-associated protein Csm2 [Runella sp.]
MQKPNETIQTTVLTNGVSDTSILNEWGSYLAKEDKDLKSVSTSQIRKFFGAIKRIQADFEQSKGEILLLDAKLAYAVGRDFKNGSNQSKIKEFYDLISPLIKDINQDKKKFKHFVNVFEAIVAYHKAAGGN